MPGSPLELVLAIQPRERLGGAILKESLLNNHSVKRIHQTQCTVILHKSKVNKTEIRLKIWNETDPGSSGVPSSVPVVYSS